MSSALVTLRPDHRGVEILDSAVSPREVAQQLRDLAPGLRARLRGGHIQLSFTDAGGLLDVPALDWAPDARRAVANRRDVQDRAARVLADAARVRAAAPADLRASLPDRPLLQLLDDHQLRNVAQMTLPSGWGSCIFDEQGTGKTPTVIAAFDVLAERNEVDVLIVVAPKSMIGEWGAEFDRFTTGLYHVAVVQGTRHQRATALASGADVVVANFEGAVAHIDDLRLLATRSRAVLAIDESFNIKNPDAARTAAIAELREWCVRCFALCGTPAPNAPRDVVSQVDLVDFGLTFGSMDRHDDPEEDRALVADALHASGLFSRNLKQQVLAHLPGRRFTEVRVPFETEQGRLYAQALDGLIDELRGVDDAEFARRRMAFGERRSALLRLCSHPGGVVDGYGRTPAKLAILDDLLYERVMCGDKLVLWSYYRHTLDVLAERYAHHGVARIDGSISDVVKRRDAVRRFQEDDETMVFLGNPAAAGAGLTLHRAAVAIYESFSNQAAHFMQSLDRIHRRGQAREVEYLVLLCRGSIEEDEYARVLRKVDAQADLLGDPTPKRETRSVALDQLLHSRERLAG